MKMKTYYISFDTEQDRVEGFSELIRNSEYGFSGVGHNEFGVKEAQLKLLDSKHIRYTIVEKQKK